MSGGFYYLADETKVSLERTRRLERELESVWYGPPRELWYAGYRYSCKTPEAYMNAANEVTEARMVAWNYDERCRDIIYNRYLREAIQQMDDERRNLPYFVPFVD